MPRRAARPGAGRAASRRRHRLVFEIGTEELPPSAAWEGGAQLRDAAVAALAEARIAVREVRAFSTPRRLALIADGVAPRQGDLVREVRGPAVRAAFDPDGKPTAAAEGFARAQGVPAAALERRTTPAGEYVFAVRRERGSETFRVLAGVLPEVAGTLAFARPMRWAGAARFARPVRWLLALLDGRIVPCEFAGVRSGRRTRGHRFAHPGPVLVPAARVYEAVLRRAGVLLDPEARRRLLAAEITRAARRTRGAPILDPDLLDETVQLVEAPAAFAGRFDEEFLALPREVLITVMQHHQKYFAVEAAGGSLLPAFVGVRNGGRRGAGVVREGNEWVLHARLADARFFFDEDRRQRLESRLPALAGVVFLERLGTMAEKVRRLERLAELVAAERWGAPVRPGPVDGAPAQAAAEVIAPLARAARLSKADLVTQMVRELPELQGIMGGIYARLDGEPEGVAAAIQEQYLPKGALLPRSAAGAWLGLLDKADTLLGALAAGMAPSGSQDPYGLRRAVGGIVAIVLDRSLPLDLRAVFQAAINGYPDTLLVRIQDPRAQAPGPSGGGAAPESQARIRAVQEALDLCLARLRGVLIEEGIGYDTVDAALAAPSDDLWDAAARARALWVFRKTPEFGPVYTALDRAARILPKAFAGQVKADGLADPAERTLLTAIERVRPDLEAAVGARRYADALRHLAGIAAPVDRFFTDVLVMAEDEAVRRNRLALLRRVVGLAGPIADFSRLVVPAQDGPDPRGGTGRSRRAAARFLKVTG